MLTRRELKSTMFVVFAVGLVVGLIAGIILMTYASGFVCASPLEWPSL